jgi:hypothetical protein
VETASVGRIKIGGLFAEVDSRVLEFGEFGEFCGCQKETPAILLLPRPNL